MSKTFLVSAMSYHFKHSEEYSERYMLSFDHKPLVVKADSPTEAQGRALMIALEMWPLHDGWSVPSCNAIEVSDIEIHPVHGQNNKSNE